MHAVRIPGAQRIGRPSPAPVRVTIRAGIRRSGGAPKIRPRDAEAVIAAAVNAHVGPFDHVTVDALPAVGCRVMKMMFGAVIKRRFQAGKARVALRIVALGADRVAPGNPLRCMRIVTIEAPDPLRVHL